ncbi:MAG: methyltransferase [Verrucomicrobia bacterium]|nr:methyltransferase [Verrucomicrobiota bacterium]
MTHPLAILPATDPAQILRLRDRQYGAELIAAALMHFDFFSWLDQNAGVTDAQICTHFGFTARPTDVLLTLCRANGFIRTDAGGGHYLAQLGREHLVKGSPWYLGPYYAPIQDTPIVQGFLKVLRTGKPANWQAKTDAKDWHESMLDEDFARSFTDLMNSRGMIFGQYLAKAVTPLLGSRLHLLDVGGGSGIYSSTMVAAHPQLSATVLEQPPVDAIVRKEIAKHGLSDHVQVASGDMFHVPWPETDIVLLSNVLHDWDVPEMRALLVKAAETLTTGGLLIIHDAFINDDKTGPHPVAEYSALLMNITQGKCYSPAEYGAVLSELGFEVGAYQETVADRGFITAVKR